MRVTSATYVGRFDTNGIIEWRNRPVRVTR
jgi:hypothetical protein